MTGTIRQARTAATAVMSLDSTGAGRKRWTMRWKGAMNAFDLAFDGRLTTGQL
ncbi:hypothetical protein [Streptomyces sp. NPDC056982]|uniref:hypothetical protein n=1 Tax=Streptomyces sp. NPDC056982 TaxID=3345986 RepID=UPI003634AD92